MSTAVANNSFKAYLANEELVRKMKNAQGRKLKEKSKKVVLESSHSKYFTNGVRAPLLSDIKFGQSCRLDVVRPLHHRVTRSTSPESPGKKHVVSHIPLEKECSNVHDYDLTRNNVRTIKYLLPNGSLRSSDEPKISSRSVSNLEVKWKRSDSKLLDARDVLYRNTYCNSHIKFRYHTCTLPSIVAPNINIPRVSKNKVEEKRRIFLNDAKKENSKYKKSGTLDLKTVDTKILETSVEVGFLKVKQIKSNADKLDDVNEDFLLTVRQPTDLLRQNSNNLMELRTERPLKYETVSPAGSRLNRKHSNPREILPCSVRDYKSVDAYKEYVEALKLRMELNSEASARHENDAISSPFGRDNRILQSVMEVNKSQDLCRNLTRDSKSLVIEIKPTWKEVPNGLNEEAESDNELEASTKCPANTPAQD